MYIENFKEKERQEEEEKSRIKAETEFTQKQARDEEEKREQEEALGEIFLHWQAPEYESYERDKKWYTVMTLGLIAIIAYALFTNSPIMAITFILIGIVEFIYINREPKMLDFMITESGVIAGKEIYEFEQIESFWIFYDPRIIKSLSLRIKSNLMPFLQIPIYNEDPEKIHKILTKYIPEIKQDYRLRDSLNRMLRL